MTTGQQLVDAAATFLGEPYSTAPGRTSPTSGFKDCSGLIAAAYEVATGSELGAYVSVTIWKQSADQGLAISRDEALGIAGACLLIPEDPLQGWGPNGHIGFSTGDGFTIEATPAYRGGVQRLPVSAQRWGSNACLLPGINYSGEAPKRKGQHMIYVDAEKHVALAMEGPIIVGEFSGNPDGYGIPRDALAYAGDDIPLRVVPGLLLAKLRKSDEIAMTAPVVQTVPGECPPGVADASVKELVAALASKV